LGKRYVVIDVPKDKLYEALDPKMNAGLVEMPDEVKLVEQLLGLVVSTSTCSAVV
jgi:hypothetical protein